MRLDPKMQRRVWSRVYKSLPQVLPQPRQDLRAARDRALQNLRFFDGRKNDPIYGPAYERLAQLSRQMLAMLEQIG